MSDGKPVEVMRGGFGGWYSVSAFKDLGDGTKLATRRNPISNADQLENMYESHGWLLSLLEATGKTCEEIAADYDLTIEAKP